MRRWKKLQERLAWSFSKSDGGPENRGTSGLPPSHQSAFSGCEVLEERCLLSGTTDDMSDGGGMADYGELSGVMPLPETFNGADRFDNGLSLPEHWKNVLPTGHSWNSANIFTFRSQASDGTSHYVITTTDTDLPEDPDQESVSVWRYSLTVNVQRTDNLYQESVQGHLEYFQIAAQDGSVRDRIDQDTFELDDYGFVRFESNLNYRFQQSFENQELVSLQMEVEEQFDVTFDWQPLTFQYLASQPDAVLYNSAQYQLSGALHGNNSATFDADVSDQGIQFQIQGAGRNQTGGRAGATEPILTHSYEGSTTLETGDLDSGIEGRRETLAVNGTREVQSWSDYQYTGSGTIAPTTSGYRAVGHAVHAEQGNYQFQNDVDTRWNLEQRVINAAALGTETAQEWDELTSGSGFIVNLGDDEVVENTIDIHQEYLTVDQSTGHEIYQSDVMIEYLSDGDQIHAPGESGARGRFTQWEVEIDQSYIENTSMGIVTEIGGGYHQMSVQRYEQFETTGQHEVLTYDQSTARYSSIDETENVPEVTGLVQVTGSRDETTSGVSRQTISQESEQRIVLFGGAIPILSDPSLDGTDGDDSEDLSGSDGSGTEADVGTPDLGLIAAFNDFRRNETTLQLVTRSTHQETLDQRIIFHADGAIETTDNGSWITNTEFLGKDSEVVGQGPELGSYLETEEVRTHSPVDPMEESVEITQRVDSRSHRHSFKELSGTMSQGEDYRDLTTTLTPVPPESNTQTDDGEVTAIAESHDALAIDPAQYEMQVTGTLVGNSSGSLEGQSIAWGDQEISYQSWSVGEAVPAYQLLMSTAEWHEDTYESSSGNQQVTTTFHADGSRTLHYQGQSSELVESTRVIAARSTRQTYSGDLPDRLQMIPPGQLTPDDWQWINDEWMIDGTVLDVDLEDDTIDNQPINEIRDRFEGSFEWEHVFEQAENRIQTQAFSGTVYDFSVQLTPKPSDTESTDGGESLEEPTVETGADTTAEVEQLRDHYDLTMTGQFSQMNVSAIENTTLESYLEKVQLRQESGVHPGSEEYVVSDFANNVLPEWLNRHRVRSGAYSVTQTIFEQVVTTSIDNLITEFDQDGTVVTRTLTLPPVPSSDEGGMLGGVGSGTESEHPLGLFADQSANFHARVEAAGSVADELSSEWSEELQQDNAEGGVDPGAGGEDDRGELYLTVQKTRWERYEEKRQELVFMDDLDSGQGFVSFSQYHLTPLQDVNRWESSIQIVRRDLTATQTLDEFLDQHAASDPVVTSSDSTSGETDSSSTVSVEQESEYQQYALAGEVVGWMTIRQGEQKASEYRWEQVKKVHAVTLEGLRTQTDMTKTGNRSYHREYDHGNLRAEFFEDGSTRIDRTVGELRVREWDVASQGVAKTRGLLRDEEILLDSTNLGFSRYADRNSRWHMWESDGTRSWSDLTGNRVTQGSLIGQAFEECREWFVYDPGLQQIQPISRITQNHIQEMAGGSTSYTYVSGMPTLDAGSQLIVFQRHRFGQAVTTFLNADVAISPYESWQHQDWGGLIAIDSLESFAYGELGENVDYFAIATTLETRLMGLVTLMGGVVEIVGGVVVSSSGIGAGFGVVAVVHGIDTVFAGSQQLLSGGDRQTLTAQAASSAFLQGMRVIGAPLETDQELEGARSFGDAVDLVVGLADMAVGTVQAVGRLTKAAHLTDTATGARAVAGITDQWDDASRLRRLAGESCSPMGQCFVAGVPVAVYQTLPMKPGDVYVVDLENDVVEDANTGLLLKRWVASGGVVIATVRILNRRQSDRAMLARKKRSPTLGILSNFAGKTG